MRTFPARALATLLVIGVSSRAFAQPKGGPELLEFIRDAHKAARELIRTCSCTVEFSITISPPGKQAITQSCSSKYFLSPNASRAISSEGGQEYDYLWQDSVRSALTRAPVGGRSKVSAARDPYTQQHGIRCDPWVRGLLVLNVPDTSHYLNLEEFVENSRKAATAEWVSEQGRKMAAIKLFFEHSEEPPHAWNVTIYTDPDVNYLVRKVVYASSGKVEYRREEEVIEFKDGGGGVFFPESTVGRSENGGKPYSSLQCQVKDIRINESLPQDAFRLRYPRGTQLNDNIRGVTYTVDEDGRQISKESAQNRGPQAAPAAFPASPMTETREEPAGIGRWILIAFLAVGLIGLVVIVLRHRMRQVSS